ncbi:MAG: VWA domain-containing protein, partial [Kiritimatiellae bacterium]|nr:VWA domain-containing protein [Kiritimatiellia bacterium]
EAEFDAPVKVGEIRIFADMARPFVALVAEERGVAGWLLVPVSPFTVPASPRELLEGERVYQLWNACTAARSFVARSWRVDEMDADVLAELRGRCAARTELAADGIVAEYEREFLVSGGDFIPLVDKDIPCVVHVSWRKVCGFAACFVVLLGFSVVTLTQDQQEQSPATPPSVVNEETRMGLKRARQLLAQRELDGALRECENVLVADPANEEARRIRSSVERKREVVMRQEREVAREKWIADVDAAWRPTAAVAGAVSDTRPWNDNGWTASPDSEAMKRRSYLESNVPWNDHAGAKVVSGSIKDQFLEVERQPAGTERYAEIKENEYRDPTSEPLSTFGLDVDTSSYTTMRRYLTEWKSQPPKGSVRLEEFVNYFKYRYPQPKGDDPIAVACEMGVCPWAPTHKLLRVGVQAREVPVEKLPPCKLTFLIDVSGSMGGNGGFDMMKAGLKMLVGKLRPEDRVAIVTYAYGTRVQLDSTPGSKKSKIRAVVDGLRCGGCTYGAGGIQLAYEEAKKNFDKNANNRVILITDGDFNVGISDPKLLEEFIATKRESGVFLTVLGVGRGNYQDATMKKLANAGNGNYAYLDSVLEAKKVMMNEFGGTLFTVAKDVKLQLEFNPAEVKGYRLLGYESRRLAAKDFNDDKKDAGEIGSGHTMTAFYEIVPAGSDEKIADVDPLKYQKRTESGRGEVCTVKLRWKKPDGDTSMLKEIPISEAQITSKTPSEDFRFASAVAEFALLASDSKFKGGASFDKILDRARHAKGEDLEGYRAEFIRLVETAQLLAPPAPQTPPAPGGNRPVEGDL